MGLARNLASALVVLAIALFVRPAHAHAMRSMYIEIVESTPGHARVTARSQVPVSGVRIVTSAPCALTNVDGASDTLLLGCPSTLDGAILTVEGLGPITSEAVVWLTRADGNTSSHLVTIASPALTITPSATALGVASDYVRLGIHHIFTGPDHLLFLLALVVALRKWRAVLLAETAFTLSHSISFSAAALGYVHVSSAAAEACIALSLVLIALDIGKTKAVPAKRGAVLAFAFGLVHGLGFAGGLAEIGLPARAIPSALIGFASGVELGQVVFLAAILALFGLARRLRFERPVVTAAAYAVGIVGFFWLFERLRALFPSLA